MSIASISMQLPVKDAPTTWKNWSTPASMQPKRHSRTSSTARPQSDWILRLSRHPRIQSPAASPPSPPSNSRYKCKVHGITSAPRSPHTNGTMRQIVHRFMPYVPSGSKLANSTHPTNPRVIKPTSARERDPLGQSQWPRSHSPRATKMIIMAPRTPWIDRLQPSSIRADQSATVFPLASFLTYR